MTSPVFPKKKKIQGTHSEYGSKSRTDFPIPKSRNSFVIMMTMQALTVSNFQIEATIKTNSL